MYLLLKLPHLEQLFQSLCQNVTETMPFAAMSRRTVGAFINALLHGLDATGMPILNESARTGHPTAWGVKKDGMYPKTHTLRGGKVRKASRNAIGPKR